MNNGLARRSWARNPAARFAISRAMESDDRIDVTMPNIVDERVLRDLFEGTR